jgi:hypothetical protein
MAQQALASPIEITSANDSFTFDYDLGGVTPGTLYNGTYACALTMLYNFDIRLGAYNAGMYAYLSTDYKAVIATTGARLDIVWTDAALMRLLGFRDDLAGSTSYTATDTLGKMWIPPYYSADLNHPEDDTAIAGGNAIDGTFSGISLAPGNYMRQYQWQAVASEDVLKSACEASYTYGSVYYPEQERCLEEFTINALSASPTGTEGISIKGCYYVEDLASYEGASAGASKCPSSMDGGGVRTRLTSSPDNYTFCHLKPARWTKPVPTIDTHNSLYNVGVELITAIGGVPTWSKP